MAQDTPLTLRNLNIYSIFTRNYSQEGTFKAVQEDLDRIKALGTDVIWFLPFYPNGEVNKKGTIGSPYAISNYREIDPRHGTLEDFKELIKAAHDKGLKVMIDIVFNHTSPDSYLVKHHPDWFYKKPNGDFGNRVGDWYDVIDLDYNQKELWNHQLETIEYWAQIVDGFRCDVAPLVPLDFWRQARQRVQQIKSDFIWLAESIEPNFIRTLRGNGLTALSDSECYEAFDLTYDYDVSEALEAYLDGDQPLSYYIHHINQQDVLYPSNYVKMHHLENHDRNRIASRITHERDLIHWTAFNYLQKGAVLIYNGQEVQSDHTPSLFDPDQINWQWEKDLSPLMSRLAHLHKTIIPIDNSIYTVTADDETQTVTTQFKTVDEELLVVGHFNLQQTDQPIKTPLSDGEHTNLINDQSFTVRNGRIEMIDEPILVKVSQ